MVIGITGIIVTTVVAEVTVGEIAVVVEAAAASVVAVVVAVRIAGRVGEIGGPAGRVVETGGPVEQAQAADKRRRRNKRFEITRK
jgi:hypothetical protein